MGGPPDIRIRAINREPVQPTGRFVLYWMTAARRTGFNYGLARAVEWANRLARPLLILEALRVDYPWASARTHAFILQGMAANKRALAGRPVRYYPFVEARPGRGKGLLSALGDQACVVVADQFPCFFLPRMLRAAADQLRVRLEAVDSCGLVPLAGPGREFKRAYDFRRFLQRNLAAHLGDPPPPDPLSGLAADCPARIPRSVLNRWPEAPRKLLSAEGPALAGLPLDQEVGPVDSVGGSAAGAEALELFLENGLDRYAAQANHPGARATSNLSPYLHFGHISSWEIFLAVADRQGWGPHLLDHKGRGGREGWLGMSPGAEAFLDQLVTWRELAFNLCFSRPDHDRYSALPEWAQRSLAEHGSDQREHLYSLDQLARAETHDPLWNAAQNQLLREGVIHNYLRMVWGKRILEWSPSPRQALVAMIELNNRFGLDGRDPNSYAGILWVLGRFDRAWGPERPIFGKIRYMSSANAIRKLKFGDYLERFGPPSA